MTGHKHLYQLVAKELWQRKRYKPRPRNRLFTAIIPGHPVYNYYSLSLS